MNPPESEHVADEPKPLRLNGNHDKIPPKNIAEDYDSGHENFHININKPNSSKPVDGQIDVEAKKPDNRK